MSNSTLPKYLPNYKTGMYVNPQIVEEEPRPSFYYGSPFPDVKPASNIVSQQYGGIGAITDEVRKLNLAERQKNIEDTRNEIEGFFVTSGGGNIVYPNYEKTTTPYKYRKGGYIQMQDAYSKNKCKPQDWW